MWFPASSLLGARIEENPEGLVAKAYRFAEDAHRGQKRESGDSYFTHPVRTAETLSEWKMDDATIAAGLLHDTVEDTPATLEKIEQEFGKDVAFLVDGVTKLGRIKYRGDKEAIETFKKMILALSEDLRVIFVRLADRLHNMETLSALPEEKQERIARETDEIYAPLALRLGMHELYGELRDLAFPYLHPDEYAWLKRESRTHYRHAESYLKKLNPKVARALREQHIVPARIEFRVKRLGSLYHKLVDHDMDMEKVYDLVAMRLIMKNLSDCYAALGTIHGLWPPLPGRVRDYIAMPKPNGYQSLHTTVIGPGKQVVEFQIRTKEMHEQAEYGIAATWIYKQEGVKARPKSAKELPWVLQLKHWQETFRDPDASPDEFLESVKVDFFKDRIFAITPKGEVVDLPREATPVDFAYHIHSEIGNTCVGAKVNHTIVPLDRRLQSGDLVEILTQKRKRPSEDWLSFVKTTSARDHIRDALRRKKFVLDKRIPQRSEIKVIAEDRKGLLKDVAETITRSHVNISKADTDTLRGSRLATLKFTCETADPKKLEKIVLKFKKIKGVKEVKYQLLEP